MESRHHINLTDAWKQPDGAGTAWTRRFGRPGGITPDVRLWLAMSGVTETAAVLLNDRPLVAAGDGHTPTGEPAAPDAPWRCEITGCLGLRNTLTIILPSPSTDAHAVPSDRGPDSRAGRTLRRLPASIATGVRLEIEAVTRHDASLDTRR